MPPKVNQKAVAAKEKKAANQAVKDAEAARKTEAAEAAEWAKGSNARAASKAEVAGEVIAFIWLDDLDVRGLYFGFWCWMLSIDGIVF